MKIIITCTLIIVSLNLSAFQFGVIISPNGVPAWKIVSKHKYKKNIFHIRINEEKSIATGFILNNDSHYIITNAHVALTLKLLELIDKVDGINDNGWIKITAIKIIDKELDFALLEFEWIEKKENINNIYIYLKRNELELNEKVYVIGYSPQNDSFVLSNGTIIETEYSRIKKPCFKYDADTAPGMSGSPVFNMYHQLVGLHYGSPEQNKNNAIPFFMIIDKYATYF